MDNYNLQGTKRSKKLLFSVAALGLISVIGVVAVLCNSHVAYYRPAKTFIVPDHVRTDFANWKIENGKEYMNDDQHHTKLQVFYQNWLWVENFYATKPEGSSLEVGLNRFADMTNEEFVAGYVSNGQTVNRKKELNIEILDENVPAKVDWRDHGAVTPVKDQGQCGSCWAFSTTGSMEGAYVTQLDKTLTSFSEQQLVDCSTAEGNQGCNGGWVDQGFDYAKSHCIEKETDYTYKAVDGTCHFNKAKCVVQVTSYVDVTPDSDTQLTAAVAITPVSVAIEADQQVFQFYTSGVLDHGCGTNLDHAVLVVGYDTTSSGEEYYIVKNSWAASWGNDGYLWIKRGQTTSRAGMCGILSVPSYPKVKAV